VTHGHRHERGIAVPAAILLILAASLVAIALVTMFQRGLQSERRTLSRDETTIIAETASYAIRDALRAGTLSDADGYAVTDETYAAFAAATAGSLTTVTPGSPAGWQPPIGDLPVLQVSYPFDGGRSTGSRVAHWQLFDVRDEGVGQDVFVIRTWLDDGEDRSEARVAHFDVTVGAGRFSDLQMVVDGPIYFASSATVDGSLHSNGAREATIDSEIFGRPIDPSSSTIDSRGQINCEDGATLTTGDGAIANAAGTCALRANTGVQLSTLRAEESFLRARRACNNRRNTTTNCFLEPMTGSFVPAAIADPAPDLRMYEVRLEGDRAHVYRREVNFATERLVPIEPGGPTGYSMTTDARSLIRTITITKPKILYFNDSVAVSGNASWPVTIMARQTVNSAAEFAAAEAAGTVGGAITTLPGQGALNGDMLSGAADIYVVGDLTHGDEGSIGLVAQGSVLLEAIAPAASPNIPGSIVGARPCVSKLQAAIFSTTGVLSVDPRYVSPRYDEFAPSCDSIEILGSITSHRAPTLKVTWSVNGVEQHMGYDTRELRWDEALAERPPPGLPLTSPWNITSIEPADLRCYDGGDACD
jgi:hypothetical protein